MRHPLSIVLLVTLCLLVGSGNSVRAEKQEHNKPDEHKADPKKTGEELKEKLKKVEDPELQKEAVALVDQLVKEATTAEAHEEKKDEGIFGPPKRLTDTGIWTLVIFVLLLFVLGKFAWGPMLQGLRNRETSIAEAKQFAEEAKVEAETLRLKLREESEQASKKAADMIEEARNDASRSAEDLKAKAREEIEAEKDRAMRDIAVARDQVLQEVFAKAPELAAAIASKAIRRQVSADDHRQFLDEAIAELNQNGAA